MSDSAPVNVVRSAVVADYTGYPPLGKEIDTQTCEVYQVGGGVVVGSWAHGDLGQLFRRIAGKKEGAQ
jgi:hypothetical protein